MTEIKINIRDDLVENLGFTPAQLEHYSDVTVKYLNEKILARDQYSIDWFDTYKKYIGQGISRYDYHSDSTYTGTVLTVRPPNKSERQQGVRVFHLLVHWHTYTNPVWVPVDSASIKFNKRSLNVYTQES